jgi:acid stress-induced BolA-like protein IbaG/YrbA
MAKGVALRNKVRRVLSSALRGSEVSIDDLPASDRIHATVVWKGFSGKDQIRRWRITTRALEAGLGPEQIKKVGLVMAFTPRELARIRGS